MARGRKHRRKVARADTRATPTAETMAHVTFVSAGMAHKRVPVIETMLKRRQLRYDEYQALAFYRDQAALAERSPIKSCLDDTQGGGEGSGGYSAAVTSAIITTARIERDIGSLRDIARAVAVDDKSLSQWCIDKHGGRERYDGRGSFVAIVPVNEKRHMEIAAMELRMAAHRIVR